MDWLRDNIEWLVHWNLFATYFLIFVFAVVEGPKLSVVCGVFAAMALLDPFIVYILVVLGDVVGDAFHYGIGRYIGPTAAQRFLRYVGVKEEHLDKARKAFGRYSMRALVISKLVYGPGLAGLVIAGALKYPYRQFFWRCLVVSFPQAAVFVGLGYFVGNRYEMIAAGLSWYAAVCFGAVAVIGGFLLIRHWVSPKIQKIIKNE